MASPSLPPIPHTATIKIADDSHPVRSDTAVTSGFQRPGRSDTAFAAGGIYHARNISRASFDRRSLSRHRTNASGFDGEEGDEWRKDDGHKKQVFKGTTLLWLAYQSIGVIYGDIGTSPLYVFSSAFSTGPPSYSDVLQVLSIIIWSLTIVVTLKYVIIILHADNDGEGGTFSCYSLLTRYANLTERDPREQATVRMQRALSSDIRPSNRTFRDKLERSKFIQGLLKVIGVLAVSMVMSDGVLTPAQSVLGAVQGLNVVKPDISSATVVGVSCAILVLLFAIQPLGLSKLGTAFAPILILWLAFLASFGIYNLVVHDPSVLKAFNPYYVFQFFIDRKTDGWRMLGGILLAFTGVEALFADLGAFSMRAIQISWLCWTYPCLLLGYIGQAAYLSRNPDGFANPLYNSVPPGMLYPTLIVAILAAIIASQAIITATFQLINQIMKLSYCPQVKVVHTSKTYHGQVYVPFLNWLLLVGTVLVTAIYNNTTSLGNAYGVCVMFVTFFDTCMVTLVAVLVWRVPPYLVVLPWLFFATIDGLFLSSALLKVPDGAWFTITLSAVLACLFLLWRFGKENQWNAEAEDRIRASSLLQAVEKDGDEEVNGRNATKDGEDRKLQLAAKYGGDVLSSIRGFGIFFDKTGVLTPAVFTHFVTKFSVHTDVMVFFHLHPVEAPTVPDEDRYSVTRFTTIPGCYRLVIKHGFMDEVVSRDLSALMYEQVRKFVVRQAREREEERGLEVEKIGEDMPAVVEVGHVEEKVVKSNAATTAGDGSGNATGGSSAAGEDTTTSGDEKAEPAILTHRLSRTSQTAAVPSSSVPIELRDAATAAELARLDRAYAAKILYVVGKGQMRVRSGTWLGRRVLLSFFLWIRDNTRAKIANLRLAMERVVEVGFVKDI